VGGEATDAPRHRPVRPRVSAFWGCRSRREEAIALAFFPTSNPFAPSPRCSFFHPFPQPPFSPSYFVLRSWCLVEASNEYAGFVSLARTREFLRIWVWNVFLRYQRGYCIYDWFPNTLLLRFPFRHLHHHSKNLLMIGRITKYKLNFALLLSILLSCVEVQRDYCRHSCRCHAILLCGAASAWSTECGYHYTYILCFLREIRLKLSSNCGN
jgi:hypothetical protein